MQRKVNDAVIVVNLKNREAISFYREVERFLEDKRITWSEIAVNSTHNWQSLRGADIALSIGGDGTLLFCARILAGFGIPILAVNLGDFGFITEISKNEWKEAFCDYVKGVLGVSERLMIDVFVHRGGKKLVQLKGLNDAVICTSGISKIIRLKVYLSKTYISNYRADGVIIATPTGSTAYSMAAGGPILHPEMEAFVLNPICPFTLSNRPLVVPGDEILEIEVEENQRTDVILTVDGQESLALKPKDRIVFAKAREKTLIIHSNKRNFYEVLRAKLNWTGEPRA